MQTRPIPPMEIKIWFRKSRGQDAQTGQLCVELRAGTQRFGPRSLPIHLRRKFWNPARQSFSGPDAERLTAELDYHRAELRAAKTVVEASVRTGALRTFNLPDVWATYRRVLDTGTAALPAPPPPPTVADVWAELLTGKKGRKSAGTLEHSTVEADEKLWRRFAEFVATLPAPPLAEDLTPELLYRYEQWFLTRRKKNGQPYARNYVSKCLAFVKELSRYAHKSGKTTYHALGLERLRWEKPTEPDVLTEAQHEALRALRVELWEDRRLHLYGIVTAFLFAREIGTHFTDYYHLAPAHLKTDPDGAPYVERARSKTDGVYRVWLSDYAASILREVGGIGGLPRFSRDYDTALLIVNRDLKEIQRLAEIPFNLTFSCARDSFYTELERKNAPLKVRLVSMGWRRDNSQHYSGRSDELVKQVQLGTKTT